MTVQQLIAHLSKLPQTAEVICQSDSEGNEFSPLHSIERGRYVARNSWSGEPAENKTDGVPAIFIVPTR